MFTRLGNYIQSLANFNFSPGASNLQTKAKNTSQPLELVIFEFSKRFLILPLLNLTSINSGPNSSKGSLTFPKLLEPEEASPKHVHGYVRLRRIQDANI